MLMFGSKWKLNWRTFVDPVSTLRQNYVDRIASIQRRWTNAVSSLKFGWKWKLRRRMFVDVVSALTKQRWNNVDRVTLIQCWWPNFVSTLALGWKRKVDSRHAHWCWENSIETTCQYFSYWGLLESGSIIKQNELFKYKSYILFI